LEAVHELAIAESVLETITARTGDRQVVEVRLEVGKLSGISAESLRFCFELAAAGTSVDGAELDIVEPAGRARCVTCAEEFVLLDPILLCACGSSDVRVTAGDELRIVSVEMSRWHVRDLRLC
jgi:hydrogenase nickel incorporation protein HypA/HybF